jgi:hypothetical protein
MDVKSMESLNAISHQPGDFQTVLLRKGFDVEFAPELLLPDDSGLFHVEIGEIGRLEIDLGRAGSLKGYLVVGEELKPLPVGSALNAGLGTFSWMPAPGFFGEYDFIFLKEYVSGRTSRIPISVTINPKFGRK